MERRRRGDIVTATALSGGLLIGGDRITDSSGGTLAHIYPATGQPNATIPLAGTAEIDRAVASAWHAHREWMSLTVDRRRDLLIDLADAVHENLDELARLNVQDYAVPISFASNGILLERFLRHFAGYVDKPHGTTTPVTGSFDINLIEREPYGVVGVITPWNGSLVVIGSCVAPALAAGNAVVLKPSEVAPFAALRFGELCVEVGLPAGLVNVVPAGPEGGDALVRHPGIRKIHFTGGSPTARKVLQAAAVNLTPVVTELGGKSANIIFADADLDAAAMLSAHQGPLMQSGQSCACASRVLVHDSVYDAFVEKFVGVIEASTVGDPLDPQVVFGPVISQAAADRILGVIEKAVAQQTTDLGRAHRVARQLEAGSVWINQFSDISPQGPYGGYKQSGSGRTGGLEGLHEFLQTKNIRIGMR
jgi:aldehyde dehydrogenase (NAD+)